MSSSLIGPGLPCPMKIIYLGNPHDFDRHTARLLWNWLNASTGNRGLVVFHAKAEA